MKILLTSFREQGYGVLHIRDGREANMAALKPIKQSDPPPMTRKTGPRGSKYDPVIEELKKKPGKWFLVVEDVTTTTSRVFKDRGCKVTTRRHLESTKGDHRVDVYAMWPNADSTPNETKPKTKAPAAKKSSPASKKAPAARRK